MNYFNGNQYTGNFFFGKKNGFGVLIMENGNNYVGNFKNDIFHGYGKLENFDGSNIYE